MSSDASGRMANGHGLRYGRRARPPCWFRSRPVVRAGRSSNAPFSPWIIEIRGLKSFLACAWRSVGLAGNGKRREPAGSTRGENSGMGELFPETRPFIAATSASPVRRPAPRRSPISSLPSSRRWAEGRRPPAGRSRMRRRADPARMFGGRPRPLTVERASVARAGRVRSGPCSGSRYG
jgi:hypothetical protein